MTPQHVHNMIQNIKKLPDHMLIRVLQATTKEMLERTANKLQELQEELHKR